MRHILVIAIIVVHAGIDAYLIKKNKPIYHIVEQLIFSLFWIGIVEFYWLNSTKYIIENCLFVLGARIALFDFALNIFRDKTLFYISPNANGKYTGTNESWWDDILQSKANYIRIICFVGLLIYTLWLSFFQ
jgi:hypothetical protein